jgi:hypothetical protein
MSTERILQKVERLSYILPHRTTRRSPHSPRNGTASPRRHHRNPQATIRSAHRLPSSQPRILHCAPAVYHQHHRTAPCTRRRHGLSRTRPHCNPCGSHTSTRAPRRHPTTGNYPYYAVRIGRTTGIFTSWADCFQATNGTTNEFRGFESLDLDGVH